MPKVRVRDIDMYYEIHGEGEPVVIINGAGATVELSYRRIPVFAPEFTLILFDNRGAGQTDRPDGPYTTDQMADDLAGLLDVIGIDSAHVQGNSMGGMIAQNFALRYPDRVRSMVLACTYCGGPHSLLPPPSEWQFLASSPEAGAEAILRLSVTQEHIDQNPEAFRQLVGVFVAHPMDQEVLDKHTAAVRVHDSYDHLHEIRVPALVMAGEADRVIPVENARLLASRIPHAELVTFPNTGHLLVEMAGKPDKLALEFFRRHQTGT